MGRWGVQWNRGMGEMGGSSGREGGGGCEMSGEMGRERCEKERLGEGTTLHSSISYIHTYMCRCYSKSTLYTSASEAY